MSSELTRPIGDNPSSSSSVLIASTAVISSSFNRFGMAGCLGRLVEDEADARKAVRTGPTPDVVLNCGSCTSSRLFPSFALASSSSLRYEKASINDLVDVTDAFAVVVVVVAILVLLLDVLIVTGCFVLLLLLLLVMLLLLLLLVIASFVMLLLLLLLVTCSILSMTDPLLLLLLFLLLRSSGAGEAELFLLEEEEARERGESFLPASEETPRPGLELEVVALLTAFVSSYLLLLRDRFDMGSFLGTGASSSSSQVRSIEIGVCTFTFDDDVL